MTRVQRHGAGRVEIDIAEAEDQVAGVEQDVAYLLAAGQAIGALDEVDVVRQPGRLAAHGFAVALDGGQRCAVLEGHRQMDDTGRHLEFGDIAELTLQAQQVFEQGALVQHAAVVAQLQRAHTGGEFLQATQRLGLERFHQQMHAQAQCQIQHVVAIFQQDVGIAGLAIHRTWAAAFSRQLGQYGGGNGGVRLQRRRWQCHRADRRQSLDAAQLRLLQALRLLEADGVKAQRVAGLDLADLPQLGLGDGHRADETAEAGAVLGQDHREVAGEVDRADGVFAVVHVGWVQAGFAAVGPRPARFRAAQTYTEAVGGVVHLPLGGEEFLDGFSGEEVRRTVRAIEHADVPGGAVAGDQARVSRLRRGDWRWRSAGR